jgi:hypothetical protein
MNRAAHFVELHTGLAADAIAIRNDSQAIAIGLPESRLYGYRVTTVVRKSLNKISRILLAPDQRSPNDLVLIGASEMPQEPFQSLIVNERCKRTALCATPGMQLDRIASVIDVALKRW